MPQGGLLRQLGMPESVPIMMAAVLPKPGSASADLPVPLARVLARLLEGVGPVLTRTVALREAQGAILGAPIVVPFPVPARATALRRGYAVASRDTIGAGPYSPLPLPAPPSIAEPGDALPIGMDAVLPEDAVLVTSGQAEAHESAAPGQWTRRAGEDAPGGTVLRAAGQRMRDIDVALARTADVSDCDIRRPRLLLVDGGADCTPVIELFRALGQSAGAEVQISASKSAADADLICAFGDDARLTLLSGQRADVVAHRLALRPGEDGSALRFGRCPVLLVPDRLADALGLWLGLALPILRNLAVAAPSTPTSGRLSRKLSSAIGVSELALLRRNPDGFEPLAMGDLPFAAMSEADAWLMIPPDSEGFAAGEIVEAELLWR